MGRSRARLAADWFAKLRQNEVTGAVEQADAVDATTALENSLTTANSTISTLQAEKDALAASVAQLQTDIANINLTTVNGNLTVNGSITATGDVTAFG